MSTNFPKCRSLGTRWLKMQKELEDLNREAVTLAATIKKNFEELGV